MGVREIWQKRFMKSLTGDEKKAFRLWLNFSDGKISEKEFKAKMDIEIMPRMLGKMNAVRLDTLEQEIDSFNGRLKVLEKKSSSG